MPAPSTAWYLLAFVNGGQWGHLAVLVGTKDLAERAGGHFTAQAVDIDLLLFVLLTHEVLLSLGVQRPEGEWAGWQDGQGPGQWGIQALRVRVPMNSFSSASTNQHHLLCSCSWSGGWAGE